MALQSCGQIVPYRPELGEFVKPLYTDNLLVNVFTIIQIVDVAQFYFISKYLAAVSGMYRLSFLSNSTSTFAIIRR